MTTPKVIALSGGIGGAKLALGLNSILPEEGALGIIANTGDDFEHLGLTITPDIDTLLYTLSGCNNEELGWGRRGETWTFMEVLKSIGGEDWFNLGDGDLALHVERTRRINDGETIADVTRHFSRQFGIAATILPMSNAPVRTKLKTDAGWIHFQDYFIRQRAAPRVAAIAYAGADDASPVSEIIEWLRRDDLRAIIICPSNPFLSIMPILAVPGIREALAAASAPMIAISPIIDGKAIKGPTAKLLAELGHDVSARSALLPYEGLLDGVVLDTADAALAADFAVPCFVTKTLMTTFDDKVSLARETLAFADLRRSSR